MPKRFYRPIRVLLVALVAHWVIWSSMPLVAQALAVLILAGFLPGFVFVAFWLRPGTLLWGGLERFLFGIGCGYTWIVVVMLLISYLPGAIPRWLPLLVFDLLLLTLVGLRYRQDRQTALDTSELPKSRSGPWQATGGQTLGLISLLLIGGFFRFANLGYAEFLTDEARVVLRAQAVVQGDENVLFLHRKGPTEILLPATILAMTGGIDEATARLPFAIASLAGLLAVFCLGRRLHSPLAGWITAMFLAFDGYLIGFSRFTQYQSVIVLTTTLAILLLYGLVQAAKERKTPLLEGDAGSILPLAAGLLATGLLSHYDALFNLLPVGWLLGVLFWQNRLIWPRLVRQLGFALLIGVGLLALFYPLFLSNAHFQATYTYLLDQRIAARGLRFPYNNLADVFQRSVIYNSAYAMLLLIGGALVALALAYQRGWARRWASYAGIGLLLLLAVTLVRPKWLQVGTLDLAIGPFLLAFVGLWLAPRLALPDRLLWLWFGLLALLTLFCISFPRTHVYIYLTPLALLVGILLAQGWFWLHQRVGAGAALAVGGLASVGLPLLFGLYAYRYFIDQREVLRTWPQNHPAGYWLPTGTQNSDALYGFPLQNGWKVIGALYAQGVLQGDYETNQRDNLISQWYTRAQNRCNASATWYFKIDSLETWSSTLRVDEQLLREQGYQPWGAVEVNGQPRLTIFKQGAVEPAQKTFKLTDYIAQFDQLSKTHLPLQYPVVESQPAQPLQINFGDQIRLEGYTLGHEQPLQAGARVQLTLYWRGQRAALPAYKVFNHIVNSDGALLAQQDSHPVCDRQRTSAWFPGELVVDRREIVLPEDAPVGHYALFTGLYQEENLERLAVLNVQGEAIDQQVHLADLQIETIP